MIEPGQERQQAVDLFNEVWALLDTADRSAEQSERMVHAAHASRLHWGAVGTAENVAVGDWLLSRVYAVLGRGEPAMYHAQWCLERAERAALPGWVRAEGHEAIARAQIVLGELEEARRGGPGHLRFDRRRGRSRRRAQRSRDAAARMIASECDARAARSVRA